jgi:hypothetical protein
MHEESKTRLQSGNPYYHFVLYLGSSPVLVLVFYHLILRQEHTLWLFQNTRLRKIQDSGGNCIIRSFIWWGNPRARDHLEDVGADGRKYKMNLIQTGWEGVEDWYGSGQGLVTGFLKHGLQIPLYTENFLISWGTISFPEITILLVACWFFFIHTVRHPYRGRTFLMAQL